MGHLSVPILFTCFGEKEKKGEEFILRQLFKACVLVDFCHNPWTPEPTDRLVGYTRQDEAFSDTDEEARLCNAIIWWACGSTLSRSDLATVAETTAPQALKELAQRFTVQGAHKGWTEMLKLGDKNVGRVALENFSAALENPGIARELA